MNSKLDQDFKKAFSTASKMEKKLPQDVMLQFYAYYKQATAGDNFSFNANFDVRNAFKFNAWMQLKGISSEEAKIKYIELVNNHCKAS
jgi:diazepam-binding inhibitor (GABA receptor modulating acyl-CoA-binding protein)